MIFSALGADFWPFAGLAWGLWTVGAVFLAKLGEPAYLVNTLECIMIAACAACEGDNLNVRPMDGQSIHEHIITVVGVEKFWYILADFVEPKGSDGIRRPVSSQSSAEPLGAVR